MKYILILLKIVYDLSFEKKHHSYSGVCRLAKRWLASHFLLEYFEEEAVDLICAYLFANPSTYDPPKSLLVGFLRFLELLTSFDWKTQQLIVDPDREITSKIRFQDIHASIHNRPES